MYFLEHILGLSTVKLSRVEFELIREPYLNAFWNDLLGDLHTYTWSLKTSVRFAYRPEQLSK